MQGALPLCAHLSHRSNPVTIIWADIKGVLLFSDPIVLQIKSIPARTAPSDRSVEAAQSHLPQLLHVLRSHCGLRGVGVWRILAKITVALVRNTRAHSTGRDLLRVQVVFEWLHMRSEHVIL